jgi:DNA-directed RNA polymerase specialized sigma24 family protein
MADSMLFEDFYGEACHRCLRAVAAHIGSVSFAEELVAEAFTRALRNWDRVSVHPSPSAWVVTTAVNLQRDSWRRKRLELRRTAARVGGELAGFDQAIEPHILQAIAAQYQGAESDADTTGIPSTVPTTVSAARAGRATNQPTQGLIGQIPQPKLHPHGRYSPRSLERNNREFPGVEPRNL